MTTSPHPKRLTQKQARAIVDTAELVKAPDWRDTRNWHVVDGEGNVLVRVVPSYGGASRSGRNGWKYHLAEVGPSGTSDKWPTTTEAAAEGLREWIRWATAPR